MVHSHTLTSPDEVFAGIDWGGSFHQLCLIDASGDVLRRQGAGTTSFGFAELDRPLGS